MEESASCKTGLFYEKSLPSEDELYVSLLYNVLDSFYTIEVKEQVHFF